MNQSATVTIPRDILPDDGRFGSGPSRVERTFVDDLAASGTTYMGTSHRRPGVQDIVRKVREGIASLYGLPDDYEVVLGVGGATAFWDASAFGLIAERSAHFVCGEFSEKFASVSSGAPHLAEPVVVSAPYGSAPTPQPVANVDVAAYIHNETSTGVMAPFDRLGGALVVVDGTSAAGAIAFDIPSVDAYYFSPQKALGSEGGLWLAIMSPGAIERIDSLATSGRWIPPFLSLSTAVANSRKNQTYNTPALATLFLLERQLSSTLAEGGLNVVAQRSHRSSRHLYEWADASEFATPFVTEAPFRSPTVVTIDFDDATSTDDVTRILRDNGIVDIEGYRKLGRNQIRIATFPNTPTADVEALTACIDHVVETM